MARKWSTISDNRVRHIWNATDGSVEVALPPTYYEDNGTPIGDNGEDMVYSHTEVELATHSLQISAILAEMAQPVEAFHTPRTKEEADSWVALQSSGDPLAGMFFMVGFNYAMEQVRQVLEGEHPSQQEDDDNAR